MHPLPNYLKADATLMGTNGMEKIGNGEATAAESKEIGMRGLSEGSEKRTSAKKKQIQMDPPDKQSASVGWKRTHDDSRPKKSFHTKGEKNQIDECGEGWCKGSKKFRGYNLSSAEWKYTMRRRLTEAD